MTAWKDFERRTARLFGGERSGPLGRHGSDGNVAGGRGHRMSRYSFTEYGLVQRIMLDGEPRLILLCPGCGMAARMDDDQAHGRVSVDHATDGCAGGYHETHDFWAAAERAGWQDGAWNEAVDRARSVGVETQQ